MDDALIQQWRDGDARATTAVRNTVRSTAERMLGHPLLIQSAGPSAAARLRREERRREITGEVAQEVMARKVSSAAQLSAMTLMVAGRHAIVALQEAHPPAEDAHLPAQVAVTYALAPSGLMPRVREAAARHLERCPHCAADQRTIQRLVASLEAAEPELVEDVQEATEGPGVEELFAAAAADLSSGSAPRPERPRPRKGKGGRVLPAPDPEPSRGRGLVAAAVVVALVGGGLWWATRNTGPSLTGGNDPALAALADRSPPEVGRLRDLPSEVQFAVADLAAGDCRTGAGRLRSARGQQPDSARLYVLEGAAFVCAGDANKALGVFSALDSMLNGQPPPNGAYWFRAQAHLLRGEGNAALKYLSDAEVHDPKHRKEATRLKAEVEAILGG